jgi:hypothetical protein
VGHPPRGALLVLEGGGSCLYEEYTYFKRNMSARYFGRHFVWLKYFTHPLLPVLAPICKQHILSPVKVRNVRYPLAELCDICLFEFVRVEGAWSS